MNQYAIWLPYAVVAISLGLIVSALWTARRNRKRSQHVEDDEDLAELVSLPYRKRLLAGLALLLIVYPSLVVTPPGHRGVIYSQAGGVLTAERNEGLSFVLPYFQSAVQIDIRTQKFLFEAFAQSSDLQEITVPIAVNTHLDPNLAAELYRDVGKDYGEVLVAPAVDQLAKQEIGLFKAIDFAQNRAEMAANIKSQLEARLAPFGIVVEFVALQDAVFDPEFVAAVKAKIIADEKAAEEARLVAAAESQAEQVEATARGEAARILIEAEAQASANRILNASLTDDLLVWQRIIGWNGQLPTTFLGDGDPLDLLFNINR